MGHAVGQNAYCLGGCGRQELDFAPEMLLCPAIAIVLPVTLVDPTPSLHAYARVDC